jgi:pimeloyl-ACP methyl ester carboxylesterase
MARGGENASPRTNVASPKITNPAWPSPTGRTLLFIHGWPDRNELWAPLISLLTKQGHTCVCFALPGYPDGSVDPTKKTPDFDDAVRDCVCAIQCVTAASTVSTTSIASRSVSSHPPQQKVTLVCHDWGCVVGYKLEKRYPELIEGLVALDVGGDASGLSKKEQSFIAAYQLWLIAAHAIGGRVGDYMTTKFARIAGAPVTTGVSNQSQKNVIVSSKLNWPYVAFWRDALFPGKKYENGFDDAGDAPVPAEHTSGIGNKSPEKEKHEKPVSTPSCPTLFVFGGAKPVRFHSQKWIDAVLEKKKVNGSDVIEIENAGHWFVVENVDETFELVEKWLKETRADSGTETQDVKIRSSL